MDPRPTIALFIIVAAVTSLAACSDPINDAERRFAIVKHSSAGAAELCAAVRAIPQAYLQRGDQAGYREQTVRADIECQRAELDEQRGLARDINGNVYMPEGPDDLSIPTNDALIDGDQHRR